MFWNGGEAVRDARSGIALDPRINVPKGWRFMTVPATVTAGPSAEIVVPAMGEGGGAWGKFLASDCERSCSGRSG